jgi:hypothetical protein
MRVFSNNEGKIYACQECSPNAGIAQSSKRREQSLKKSKKSKSSSSSSKSDDENYEDLSYMDI